MYVILKKLNIVHITDIKAGDIFYMCSDSMLEQMGDEELVDVLCCDMSWDEKREQLIELTKDNKDNHSAYIISIAEVVKEEGDEALCDDEATSKSNAVYLETQRDGASDVCVVSTTSDKTWTLETVEKEETIHNAMRRTLWVVFIVVMIAVFLIVALTR